MMNGKDMIFEKSNEDVVRVIQVIEGLKIYGDSKEHCMKLQEKLHQYGIETRLGCTCETDIWSLYVVSVPDDLVGQYKEL